MDIHFAHSLITALRDDPCVFGYSGLFPDEHSPRLIELGEAVLSGSEGTLPVKGRLGYVMVEAYQNIVRHRSRSVSIAPWGEGRSMFLLRCHTAGQQVFACNLVTRAQAKKLDTDLSDLQGLGNAELKELYLEGIQRTSKPGTRGAGLGLIEMVRRAGGGATWAFNHVDEQHDLFAISLELANTGGADALRMDGPLHRMVLTHRIKLFHVGLWSADIEQVLLDLAVNEGKDEGADTTGRREVLQRIIGAFRSVCDHASPMLLTLHGAEQTLFSLGGMVSGKDEAGLRSRLSEMNAILQVEERPEGDAALATVEFPC